MGGSGDENYTYDNLTLHTLLRETHIDIKASLVTHWVMVEDHKC